MDNLDPTSTASMQKDLKRGHDSEINELLFDMLQRGEKTWSGNANIQSSGKEISRV